tara:strand:+ start:1199 stop:1561 length:363 start_codon:yes stop_codon:yes gene_type:complete
MHPQRNLIETAEYVVINEMSGGDISFHPDAEGHDRKGSIGRDTIPPHVQSAVSKHEDYSDHTAVGPEMYGKKGTVVVSFMSRSPGSKGEVPHHAVLAAPDMSKKYAEMRMREADRNRRTR